MLRHYGLGAGIFEVHYSREKAELEAEKSKCECVLKPIPVTISLPITRKSKV